MNMKNDKVIAQSSFDTPAENVTINHKICQLRKQSHMTGAEIATQLEVPRATYYRYEKDGMKVPAEVLNKICQLYQVSPTYFFETNAKIEKESKPLPEQDNNYPEQFHNPQEAMQFLIKLPMLAAFGGYNPSEMTEDEVVDFANELLSQLKLVSYKYKK